MGKYLKLSFFSSVLNQFLLSEEEHYSLTTPGRLVAGGLAGALAQSVCYPLDVTR